MAEIVNPITGKAGVTAVPESPVKGTSMVGPGVTGESIGSPGVSGTSIPPPTVGAVNLTNPKIPVGDGVYGEGPTGVHGVSSITTGVLGENSGGGIGVTGTSAAGDGVLGTNGSSSGTNPSYGCGVRGESTSGYGVYGASKTAPGIYGTSGPGALAGQFVGNVGVSGNLAVTDVNATGNITAVNITSSGNLTGKEMTLTGNVTANDVILTGADCAEEFDVRDGIAIEPGSVVVFNEGGDLSISSEPYNKRVAGVISGAGSFRPGVILDRRDSPNVRLPLALVGKVYCKVDARYAPIQAGDMLTTSPTAGSAMKADNPALAFGAVIGKALVSHGAGEGLIPILVSLQ